jgi:3-hydroxyisobutyrate dehydrogenase
MTPLRPAVGVIGVGAMGMGVLASLLRSHFPAHARDIRPEAQAEAESLGATCHSSSASLARACDIAIVLVVDSIQADDVLFGVEGAAAAFRPGAIVMLSSTVAPDYTSALAERLALQGVVLVDAPVSGGPRRAADGTMTMMVAGAAPALARCEAVLDAVAGRVFRLGEVPGTAAKFKIVNNLLAAVNLAAGAEALALAVRAGLDPARFVEVVNASSGASWMFADRLPRALAGDFAPRAAAKILAKDAGIAAEFAARLGQDATFASAAHAAFRRLVDAGYGEMDDAVICKIMAGWDRE